MLRLFTKKICRCKSSLFLYEARSRVLSYERLRCLSAALSGEEMPIDVYDAASWMVITCLTEASIANGGMPIDIPDFTGGKWILRDPKDVAELI